MMKKAFFLFFLLIFSTGVFAQQGVPAGFDLSNYGVRVEPDKRLMTVLATLDVAETRGENGQEPAIKTSLSPQGVMFRDRMRADLRESTPADLRQKISLFVENYKKHHPKASDAQIVAPFISMAYTLSPAPDLSDPVVTGDLPGDLLDVLDFAPLVREFYRRAGFAGKIADYAKTYQLVSDGELRVSSKDMVKELLDYLHTRPQLYYIEKTKTQTSKSGAKKTQIQTIESRQRERRFYIVPEMLAPVGNVMFLNIRDEYFVIVPPDTDLSNSEVRRAYLQFVFDPLVLANAKDIAGFRPQLKTLLDERRQTKTDVSPDVFLAVSRSLVAAAEARQDEYEKVRIATAQARANILKMKTEAEKKAVSAGLEKFTEAAADETALKLSEAYENGAVLSFYFAEQFKGLEDSGFDVASSLREMILSLDANKETKRLEQFAEARRRGTENRKTTIVQTVAIENPVTKQLLEIQKTIETKNYGKAQTDLDAMLKQNPSDARIFYNIGRVASFQAEPIEDIDQRKLKLKQAQEAYASAVGIEIKKANPDKTLLSLSYVALAKIYEFYEETEYALRVYDAAIRIGDVSGGAFREAMTAKERLIKEQ